MVQKTDNWSKIMKLVLTQSDNLTIEHLNATDRYESSLNLLIL